MDENDFAELAEEQPVHEGKESQDDDLATDINGEQSLLGLTPMRFAPRRRSTNSHVARPIIHAHSRGLPARRAVRPATRISAPVRAVHRIAGRRWAAPVPARARAPPPDCTVTDHRFRDPVSATLCPIADDSRYPAAAFRISCEDHLRFA